MLFRPSNRLLALLATFIVILYLCWYSSQNAASSYNGAGSRITSPSSRNTTIVMAATRNDTTDWVLRDLPEYEPMIYSVDNKTAPLHTPMNKGKESMAYLTYIVENYSYLPDVSIFLHSHKDGYPVAWHTDTTGYSNVLSVKMLRHDTVQARGFVNLRCNWIPGCPDEIRPFRTTDAHRDTEHNFPAAWRYMFGHDVPVPERIGTPCCAQFAVSKEAIWSRPLEDYVRFRQWLMDTELRDEQSGRIFEYLWHIMFGRDAVMCDDYSKCQCDVYGFECARR